MFFLFLIDHNFLVIVFADSLFPVLYSFLDLFQSLLHLNFLHFLFKDNLIFLGKFFIDGLFSSGFGCVLLLPIDVFLLGFGYIILSGLFLGLFKGSLLSLQFFINDILMVMSDNQ